MRRVRAGDKVRVIKSDMPGFEKFIGKVVNVEWTRTYLDNLDDDLSIGQGTDYILRRSDGEWELVDFIDYAEQIINHERI